MRTILIISAASVGRLALNTARRFIYPFAPALARGLGVPLSSISLIIAMNQAAGILVLFTGPMADRLGYRIMMMVGLCSLIVGMFSAGLMPFYLVVMISLLLAGLGKSIFDPALQAYIGKRVPFEKRGMVIGILEVSWAGSTLIGIPVMGLIIQQSGWRGSFLTLGSVGLISLVALFFLLPRDRNHHKADTDRGTFAAWRALAGNRPAIAALGFGFCISAANDNLFMVYGAWLESSFSLSLVSIGIGTGVIGFAELCGEGLTAGLSDRIGLRRSVLIGGFLAAACYILLPFASTSLPLALGGLFVVFIANEFTFVSMLALCTELLPAYRATMMATLLAGAGLGRITGAMCGGMIWPSVGIQGIGLVSSGISFIGTCLLVWGIGIDKR